MHLYSASLKTNFPIYYPFFQKSFIIPITIIIKNIININIIAGDNNIDNNAASASSVYTNVDSTTKYYLAGTILTESGNAPLYQDNNVFIAKESGHLVSSKLTIGETNPDLATAKSAVLYVKGNAYHTGNIVLKGHIDYEGSKATTSMIRFINNESNANGNGISIGGGGFTVIGGGESAANLVETWLKPSADAEQLYLTSDAALIEGDSMRFNSF